MKQNIFIVFLVFTLQTFLIFSSDKYSDTLDVIEFDSARLAGFDTTPNCHDTIRKILAPNNTPKKQKLRSNAGTSTNVKVKRFKCPYCTKRFPDKSNLNRHTRKHTGEKPYQCNICSRNFSDGSSLTRHIRKHTGEKPYQCNTCKVAFSQKNNLDRHIRKHTGEKPYKCPHCSKGFSKKYDSTRHVNTCKLNPKNAITRGLGLKRSK